MKQRGLYCYKAPFYKHFNKCGLFFLLMLALMISGCGNSNYSVLSNENSEETETKNDDTTVREHWTTYSEKSGPISVELSIVADKDDHITCDGVINLSENASITGHPMSFPFENFEVTIADDALKITGTDYLATKDSNGFIIQSLSDLTLVITKKEGEFNCEVEINSENLDPKIQFEIEIFRSSDIGGSLSFIYSKWAKQNAGIEVIFPRRLFSNQRVLTGTAENALISFQITNAPNSALVSGQLHIPSNLSCNGDDIQIDLTNVFAYINENQHTFKFYQAGTLNTLDSDENPVDTAYSLLVTVTEKSVFAYSDGDDENILGRKTQYTAKISLILDRAATDENDERTTLITEIKRTDIEDTISDEVQYPILSGGTFVLEGQKTYSLYHAESSRETEDTVKTTADNVTMNLLITNDGEGLKSEGSLSLKDEACPDNQPGLFVNLNGIIPVFDEDGSFRISSPVILEKKHSSNYSTFVNADLSLLVTKQENGEFLCDATLTSDDLETAFKFSTKANYHSDETSFFPVACSLAQESSHILAWITENVETTYSTMADSNTKIDTTFNWRVEQGTPSVKASGVIGLELNTDAGPRPFEFFFYNADVAIFEDGKRITISGKWYFSSYLPNPLNDFTINLYETESGATAYTVSLFLPPSMFVDSIGHTVEFFVMADHISGASELLNIMVGVEVNPLDEILNKALISGRL